MLRLDEVWIELKNFCLREFFTGVQDGVERLVNPETLQWLVPSRNTRQVPSSTLLIFRGSVIVVLDRGNPSDIKGM